MADLNDYGIAVANELSPASNMAAFISSQEKNLALQASAKKKAAPPSWHDPGPRDVVPGINRVQDVLNAIGTEMGQKELDRASPQGRAAGEVGDSLMDAFGMVHPDSESVPGSPGRPHLINPKGVDPGRLGI